MKKTNILYWIFTGIFGLFMLSSGIQNLLVTPEWIGLMKTLGYPAYLIPFLGVAKCLGVVALVVPGFPRVKEWAYAGFFFDLVGATYSVIVMEGLQVPQIFMLFIFAFLAASYFYYHKRQRVLQEQPSRHSPAVAL